MVSHLLRQGGVIAAPCSAPQSSWVCPLLTDASNGYLTPLSHLGLLWLINTSYHFFKETISSYSVSSLMLKPSYEVGSMLSSKSSLHWFSLAIILLITVLASWEDDCGNSSLLRTSSSWWIFQRSCFHFSPVSRTGINNLFLSAGKSCGWVFVFSWLWTNIVLKGRWKALTLRQAVHFNMVMFVVILLHLAMPSIQMLWFMWQFFMSHLTGWQHTASRTGERNLLCAGQREGKMVVCHLEWTGATRVKSSLPIAQPFAKMLKVAPILRLVGFQKAL